MQSDESLNKLIYEHQALKGAVEGIQQRLSLVGSAMAELQLAIATLEGLHGEKESSLLVPVGGSSYIRVRVEDSEKLIVGVGADVAVEKTIEEAKVDFQTRVSELEKVRESLEKQFDEASTRLDSVQRGVQKLMDQRGGEAGDVRGA